MASQLEDRLYQLAAYAKARGWRDAQGWIMRHMAQDERKHKPKRKRKGYVTDALGRKLRGGEVWIRPELLCEAEASVQLDDTTQWEGKGEKEKGMVGTVDES